jgi:endonuclease/exonuclease/phosphatase (EEP) superfamily protein YafD
VLIPVAFGIRAAHVLPLLLSALVILGPINGFRTGWRRLLPQKPGKHVRVVSFNAGGGVEVAARLAEILDGWQPDILALQECGSELSEMSRKFDEWKHHDIRGLCLMTTFEILEAKVMDRSVLAQINESEAGVGGSGDVVRYKLRLPDSTVMTFTHLHLETPRKGLGDVAQGSLNLARLKENTLIRETESSLARRWVNQGQDPMVIAGDFNTPVESRIFQRHWGSFTDAFSRAGIGFGWTKDNGWIQTRIDHVLYGPGWSAERVYVDPPLRSDHRPLIVDLRLLDR